MFDYSGRNCHAHQMKRKGSQYLIILMKRDKQQQPQHLLSNERERRVFKFISLYFFHIYTTQSQRTKKTRFKEKKKDIIILPHPHQLTHTHIYLPSTPFSSSIYLL